jgi:methanogenic corrinoid protein MtbC1
MVEMRQQLAQRAERQTDEWSGARSASLELSAPARPARPPSEFEMQPAAKPILFTALAATIRNEVLPRLVLAHRAMNAPARPLQPAATIWSDAVIELSKIVVRHDAAAAIALVEAMLLNGMSLQTVYLDVLAPTARRLGVLWTEDVFDMADVTMGLWRLKEVMRELSPAFQSSGQFQDHGRSVLLLPAPGETHSFGLAMVSEFFSRDGWNVAGGPTTGDRNIGDWVRGTWFAVVGFSVGCDMSLDALATGIRLVRQRSRNRGVGIMVGGPVFTLNPELAAQVGADATAIDGAHAVIQAHSLVGLMGARG